MTNNLNMSTLAYWIMFRVQYFYFHFTFHLSISHEMSLYFGLPLPSFMGPGHFLQPECGGRCILCASLTVELWMPPPGGCAVCSLHSPLQTTHLLLLSYLCIHVFLLFCSTFKFLLQDSFTDDLPCTYPLFSLPFFFFFTKSSYYSLFYNPKALCIWVLELSPGCMVADKSVLVSCQIQKYCTQRQEPGLWHCCMPSS